MRILLATLLTLAFSLFLLGCNESSKSVFQQETPEAGEDVGTMQITPAPNTGQPDENVAGELKILHWNIESGGSQPALIADQLVALVKEGNYQLLALSEVDQFDVYRQKMESLGEPEQWQSILGGSGINEQREDDRLMILFDASRLKLIQSQELNRYGDFYLNKGRHRSPLVAHFRCREGGQDFLLIHNHLARGNAEFRVEQAAGLREFARDSSIAKIAVGDYNFDYEFDKQKGNQGLVAFLRDGIWKWIEPTEWVDTNWFDPEPDGIDNYPGSMLDFTFVSGQARDWQVTSRVIVREGDFPDNRQTSDHRPVEVVVRF